MHPHDSAHPAIAHGFDAEKHQKHLIDELT
jgi:hypothetical protein